MFSQTIFSCQEYILFVNFEINFVLCEKNCCQQWNHFFQDEIVFFTIETDMTIFFSEDFETSTDLRYILLLFILRYLFIYYDMTIYILINYKHMIPTYVPCVHVL